MEATMHGQVWSREVEKQMSDPEGASAIIAMLQRIKAGECDCVDFVHQSSNSHCSYEVAAAVLTFQALVIEGSLSILNVPVTASPESDKETEANNNIMRNLPYPFDGCFDGTLYCQDGAVESYDWAWVYTGPYVLNTKILRPIMTEPFLVPLEVGSTQASRTIMHLMEDSGVARLPYEHDKMMIMIVNRGGPLWQRRMEGWQRLAERAGL